MPVPLKRTPPPKKPGETQEQYQERINKDREKELEQAGILPKERKGFGAFTALLLELAFKGFRTIIFKPLTTLGSMAFMWMFHAIMKMSGVEGWKMINKIQELYFVKPKEWAPWVASYITEMTGQKFNEEELVGMRSDAITSEFMKAFSHKVMSSILNTIVPKGRITEDKGQQAAENFMSTNLQFQMSAWLLHLLGDVHSFGMFKSLKDLPNAISWAFGIGWLSWLVMGTPFQVSIVTPLRWKYNAYLRPTRMNNTQLLQAYRMGEIDAEKFNYEMEQQGWREEDIPILYNLTEKPYSSSELKNSYLNGWIDEKTAIMELQRSGYSSFRAKGILNYWRYEHLRSLQEKVYNEYVDLYINYKVNRSDLEVLAKQLYPDPTARELVLNLADMKKAKARVLSYYQIREAMRKGVMGVATAKKRLLNIGYSDEDANILIRTWSKK